MASQENDWIKCTGHTCPVPPETQVTVRYRDGFESRVPQAAAIYEANCRHTGDTFDVIACRPVSA